MREGGIDIRLGGVNMRKAQIFAQIYIKKHEKY